MFIPLGGSVPTASTYMNFVYDPQIAAQIAVGTSYISSVDGVKPYAVKLDPDSAQEPAHLPGRGHAVAAAPERSDDVLEPRLRQEVAGGPGEVASAWAASSIDTEG